MGAALTYTPGNGCAPGSAAARPFNTARTSPPKIRNRFIACPRLLAPLAQHTTIPSRRHPRKLSRSGELAFAASSPPHLCGGENRGQEAPYRFKGRSSFAPMLVVPRCARSPRWLGVQLPPFAAGSAPAWHSRAIRPIQATQEAAAANPPKNNQKNEGQD